MKRLSHLIVLLMLAMATMALNAEIKAPAITIGFTAATSTVSEGDGTAVEVYGTITDGPAEGTFSVDVGVVDNGTTADEDYIAPSATYTITCPIPPLDIPCNDGTLTENVLELINDSIPEDSESVTFTLSNPQGSGLVIGEFSTHTVTIEDDDDVADGTVPRIYPADTQTLNAGPDWPRFTFEPVTDAEWYAVWVGPGAADSYATVNLYEWYPADDFGEIPGICEGEVCTVPTDVWLADSAYEWWMTYYVDGDTVADYNNRWHVSEFKVMFEDISPYDITDPSTTLPDSLEWAYDEAVLWYQVWVGPEDYSESLFYNWYTASELCAGGLTCALDTSGTSFAAGNYEWWMEAWGPGDYSQWGVTPAQTFTVN